jgi:diguanylate cyclase (GGDEF)-like protein
MKKTDLRQQAEAKLSKRKKSPTTDADTLRLLQELQVHQIELEMQNEELVQARAEVEAALRQYTDLYDFSPVGYFTLARDSTISRVNLAGANLLGADAERSKLIKRRFGVFISAQSRTTFNAFLEKVFISKCKETCEISLLKDGTDPFWARIEAIFDASDSERKHEVCCAVVSDITERVQADEALRHLSTHDALTGLYNRGFFMTEMERLERGRQFPISIVMADVDGLKHTNDQEGHAVGDARLKGVAQVLTTAFRTEDVVARIGGDEFAVLLPATNATTAKVLLGRVHQVIQDHNTAHPETQIHLSIGVSTAENPMPLSVALKKADVNMYREKRGNDVS